MGTKGVVDKFDAGRKYPFTFRVLETGDRGRLLPEEVTTGGLAEEKVIANLRAGDYFGEGALQKNTFRTATIVVGPYDSATLGVLSKAAFDQMDLVGPDGPGRRRVVVFAVW